MVNYEQTVTKQCYQIWGKVAKVAKKCYQKWQKSAKVDKKVSTGFQGPELVLYKRRGHSKTQFI